MIYAIVLFIVAIVIMVAVMDLLVAPLLTELLQEPQLRDWCGIFYRCANQAQSSLVEYISMGALWNGLDSARIVHRLKSAVLLGTLVGIGYVVISYFCRRS
ncbi:hypothetical protein [Cupriavidus sp. UYPR2.512]|uniref:hypothetical protein n=1 Tax=Cupriavidus sp. UYPR2.512 TaxID=1080187 RepID=UPI0012F99048|nr:hypothetical protein [Cupriavidus sp. UYPR2.512]UIF87508.1 hypothetical protein KAF44_08445 [Cupriavidus necator]